jgi:hypothetical protein
MEAYLLLYFHPKKYQFHFVWQTAQRQLFAASIIRLSRSIHPIGR